MSEFATIKGRLAEERARLSLDRLEPRTGARVLRRFWPDPFGFAELELAVGFLERWTSAKNHVNDSSAASATVAGPMVGGKALDGTWRGGAITKRPFVDREQSGPERFVIEQELYESVDLSASGGAGDGRRSDAFTQDAFGSSRSVMRTAQEAALPDSAARPQVAGQVVSVRNARDDGTGLFRTNLDTDFGDRVQDSGHFDTVHGRTFWWAGRNCTQAEVDNVKTAAGLAEPGFSISGLPERRNRFNLFDYEIVKSPGRGAGGGGAVAFQRTWTEFRVQWDEHEGERRNRFLRFEVGVRQSPSEALTLAFVDGQDNTSFEPLGRWGFRGEYRTLKAIGEWASGRTIAVRP